MCDLLGPQASAVKRLVAAECSKAEDDVDERTGMDGYVP